MRFRLASALTLLLSAFLLPALARGEPRLHEATAWVVGSHISEAGETRDAFVLRVAGVMQAWTDKHGAEVCGYLATDGERWGVRLTTQRSQVMCLMDPSMAPDGFKATRRSEHIHTHPSVSRGGWLEVSAETERAAAEIGDKTVERRQAWATKVRVSVAGFSRDDYALGAGYLVAEGTLYHQQGRGTQSIVGSLDRAASTQTTGL